jgi:predicted flap endonuclease-1-like 5' DNA nuclease
MAAKKTAKAKSRTKTSTSVGLPNIGKPATRALEAIGVVRLTQVAKYTEAELLAIHGVGPKAIGILASALKAAGKSFRK